MKSLLSKPKILLGVIVILHLVGVVGLNLSGSREMINLLTPVNLSITCILLLANHRSWGPRVSISFAVVALVGYFSEVIGVATGLLFGSYGYGEVLGLKLFDVPLTLGLLWLLMIYGSRDIAQRISSNLLLASFLGATFMTLFDFIMEPVAVELGYWSWENGIIPFQNYAAWFLISFILHLFVNYILSFERNLLGIGTFLTQLVFFISLRVTLL